MNNYCIYIKKRKNKPYCSLLKKEITLSCCRECVNKEYKEKSGLVKKSPVKSKKIAKLERNRYSILTNDLNVCIVCGRKKDNLHEVFYGKNRLNSIRYGMVIPLCLEHHTGGKGIHFDKELDLNYRMLCQRKFEENNTREEFIKIFGKNYL